MKKMLIAAIFTASALFAESFSWHETVRVIKSEPVYKTVTIRTPSEECWDEEVPVYDNGGDGTVGAVIGGAAGGILGHQVGRGGGKTAATVGGAIIGTLVGKNLSERNRQRPRYRMQRRCKTRYIEREENRFVGYKNIAHYKGHRIVKYSDEPLKYIDMTITVSY
ncbi:glycine zipper 2TM domain-containing protein [Hydrogenimonas sp.]